MSYEENAHRDVIIHVHAVRIGTAVGDDLGHLLDDVFPLFQLTGKAANTAHIAKLLSKILLYHVIARVKTR